MVKGANNETLCHHVPWYSFFKVRLEKSEGKIGSVFENSKEVHMQVWKQLNEQILPGKREVVSL